MLFRSAVFTRASRIDPYDELLHTDIVRSLLLQGNNTAALAHYQAATDLLYNHLGVRPSEELRALYTRIMTMEKNMETDLQVIQNDLGESAMKGGAFYCEYGFFREVYRLEVRRASRTGFSAHLALLTISLPNGGIPPLDVLNSTMATLKDLLVESLRRGDVVARFSGAQFVVMLPGASLEGAAIWANWIYHSFLMGQQKTFAITSIDGTTAVNGTLHQESNFPNICCRPSWWNKPDVDFFSGTMDAKLFIVEFQMNPVLHNKK